MSRCFSSSLSGVMRTVLWSILQNSAGHDLPFAAEALAASSLGNKRTIGIGPHKLKRPTGPLPVTLGVLNCRRAAIFV
jgi:hypothetical protein